MELSRKLPTISCRQEEWAKSFALPHLGFRTKKNIWCLDCGEMWEHKGSKKTKCVCPYCETKLDVSDSLKRVYRAESYFYLIDTIEDFQVHRLYIITANYRKGRGREVYLEEVCEQWINKEGKEVFYGLLHRVNYVMDSWQGEWAIRVVDKRYWRADLYNIRTSYVCPYSEVLPYFEKLGLRTNMEWRFSPLDVCRAILRDNRAESLLKMRQYNLLREYILGSRILVDRHWPSICIANRKKYFVKDANLWLDYLTAFQDIGKDTRNPKYLCLNQRELKRAHDEAVGKRQVYLERRRKEEELKKIIELETKYKQDKLNFIGLVIQEENITIRVLNSVSEFYEEGQHMHHCVYVSGYYEREDSLILSASVNGVKAETIELSLSELKIKQCFGKFNKPTQYHEEITKAMMKNIAEIEKRLA